MGPLLLCLWLYGISLLRWTVKVLKSDASLCAAESRKCVFLVTEDNAAVCVNYLLNTDGVYKSYFIANTVYVCINVYLI